MKIIGIDPDIDKCGVCELDFDSGEIITLRSVKTTMILRDIDIYINNSNHFAIEHVDDKKPVFNRGKMGERRKMKIAQNVGMVKAAQRLILENFKSLDIEPILVHAGVGRQVKRNANLFNKLSGWTGRSNEDTRDAWAIAMYARTKLLKLSK